MTPKRRSASGAVLMLVIIPMFAGLLACMPVPIGNPEKSRIDPALSGIWLLAGDDSIDGSGFYLLQPYDKRTWLMIGVGIEDGAEADFSDVEIETTEDVFALLRKTPIGDAGIVTTGEIVLYKAWLTKLGGVTFMTWELHGGVDASGSLRPEYWFNWKIERVGNDRIDLYLCCETGEGAVLGDLPDPGTDVTGKELDKARRAWERALRKHAKNPDIYADEVSTLVRVPEDLVDKVSDLFGNRVSFDD